jgi:hypothetical protein
VEVSRILLDLRSQICETLRDIVLLLETVLVAHLRQLAKRIQRLEDRLLVALPMLEPLQLPKARQNASAERFQLLALLDDAKLDCVPENERGCLRTNLLLQEGSLSTPEGQCLPSFFSCKQLVLRRKTNNAQESSSLHLDLQPRFQVCLE